LVVGTSGLLITNWLVELDCTESYALLIKMKSFDIDDEA